MQISQLVTVRRRRWRITGIRQFDDCQLVTLTGIAPPDSGVERLVLAPFDTIEPIDRPRRLRRVRPSLWRRAARALVAGNTPPGCLRSVHHARIDVMPHQLEPALAILRGLGCRVLLADEVGLGKTIQAGIAISELRERGAADRILVLTPAGLREQWIAELSDRFGIEARFADAATMRRRAAELPLGVNPWTIERAAVTSIDYVKRPEVLPAVAADPWDVLVVDEAHAAAGDSDRRAAVGTLASRAAFVLLLTATPHSGDRQSFASLIGLGAVDDPPLAFRRTRAEVRGGAGRRVHALSVQPTTAETHMHSLLTKYASALVAEQVDAWLPVSVLHKRAFSSAWSLARSVERRLDALMRVDHPPLADNGEQLALPLDDRDGEQTRADEPPAWPSDLGLKDAAREARLLRDLLAAARVAARTESKLDAIRRILHRVNEPAIVFTEYRDTLKHLQHVLRHPAAVLHGGLAREERAEALRDFSTGRKTVLLATDAAGEGLNLHHTCRLVINLELPWNPMRLEQRVGRVDRIGQQRVVHAFHLIAARTGEARIIARLKDRIARARADIGAPDPFGGDEERAIARTVAAGFVPDEAHASLTPAAPLIATVTPDLRCDAGAEASRLKFARMLLRRDASAATVRTSAGDERCAEVFEASPDRALLSLEAEGAWLCRARGSAARAALGHRILLVYRVALEDGCGGVVEWYCAGVEVSLVSGERVPMQCARDSFWIRHLLAAIEPDVGGLLQTAAAPWREAAARITRDFASMRLHRERAIASRWAKTTTPATFQPGLFDRRAERRHVDAMVERERIDRELASRLERIVLASTLRDAQSLSGSSRLSGATPRLLLVLVP